MSFATSADDTDEPNGSVTLTVTAGDGYTVGGASSLEGAAPGEALEFAVTLSEEAEQDVTVSYRVDRVGSSGFLLRCYDYYPGEAGDPGPDYDRNGECPRDRYAEFTITIAEGGAQGHGRMDRHPLTPAPTAAAG